MAARVDLSVDYGESWKFEAVFPLTLTLVGATVDIELLRIKNDYPDRSILKLSNSDASLTVNTTTNTVSFLTPAVCLRNLMVAGKYHWRMYIQWADTVRDEIMGGNFTFKENF